MFNKLNTKTLVIIFGVLLAIVVSTRLFKGKQGESNFESHLFTIDTAKVSSIIITPKGSTEEIKLTRSGNEWSFLSKGKIYKADKDISKSMLSELPNIKAERIAGTEKNEWTQFELADSSSTWVRVEEGSKVTASFRIGKFSFQQPNLMTTYIRLSDDEKVYVVNGFLAMTFNRSANDLRDKTLVNVQASDITKISFAYPADSSFTLTRGENSWNMNNEPADSSKTVEFVNILSSLTSYDFADDTVQQGKQVFTVNVEGNNFKPFQIKAFEANTTVRYIVASTLNPDARFDGKKGALVSKVFVGKNKFAK